MSKKSTDRPRLFVGSSTDSSVRFQLLIPRKFSAKSDDQACPRARPRYVRLRPAIHRLLSPDRVLGAIFPNPFDTTMNTSRAIRPRALSQHGALTASVVFR